MLSAASIAASNIEVEKNIHIIWIGSVLRDAHLERIKAWHALNPAYQLYIWVGQAFKTEIQAQLTGTNAEVHLIDELDFLPRTKQFLAKLIEKRKDDLPPNNAAGSDCYRAKIVHDFGGWYVDTDITPVDLSKIKISPLFNFVINASRKSFTLDELSPSVFACSRQHVLMQIALDFLDLLAIYAIDDRIDQIRSKLASVRYAATTQSTGAMLSVALTKLNINGSPFIEYEAITNTEIFDLVANRFASQFERSWLLANGSMPNDKDARKPLPGVTLDELYLKNENGCMSSAPQILTLLKNVVRQVKSKNIEITQDLYTTYRATYNQVGLYAHGDRAPQPVYESDCGLGL